MRSFIDGTSREAGGVDNGCFGQCFWDGEGDVREGGLTSRLARIV